MSHKLPKNPDQLLRLGTKMLGGLAEHCEPLGITQITPTEFGVLFSDFDELNEALEICTSDRKTAHEASSAAMAEMDAWLAKSKEVLAEALGQRWSPKWVPTGFNNHSTRIPAKIEDRLALTGRLVSFFASRPSFEMHSIDVTASFGAKLHEAALRKRQELSKATAAQNALKQKWTTAFKALKDSMASLLKLLKAELGDDDSRWSSFGLQLPSARSTPRQPANVRMRLDESGELLVQCDPVPLATRYRCRMILLGEEIEFRLAASGAQPVLKITGLRPGQVVQVIVQAVNGGLQSVPSRPQIFVLPEISVPEPRRTLSRRVVPVEAAESESRFSSDSWTPYWIESGQEKMACHSSR